ncbi:hypothetical protein niasHT_030326 [Heterodera trifolii]|uniref:FLYWCH-type domain-containing protein n=1 Tax=Heterodera trifolii TaxID=157864 RepID=A0ABD2KRH6_9BILA
MSSSSSIPATLADRMKVLLITANGADIQFLVGEGEEKEATTSAGRPAIEIPDVEVGAFKVMLNFIYTNDLSELNGYNAMGVIYAGKKGFIGAGTAHFGAAILARPLWRGYQLKFWRCERKNECRVRIHTDLNNNFVKMVSEHSHEANIANVKAKKIVTGIKRRAAKCMELPSQLRANAMVFSI